MAFVSFNRQGLNGEKPDNIAIKDGQFLIDTNEGYMYLDVEEKHLPIKDRKDPNRISNNKELNATTKNGWYYLDYGNNTTFTINVHGADLHKITAKSGHLSVDGSNDKFITQTLFLHKDEGHILHRRSEDGGNTWSNWTIQDKIVKIDGSKWAQMRTPGYYYFDNRIMTTTTS